MEQSNNLIDLEKALCGDLTRLRFITRFSNCPRVHDESVAEHSFYTALYAFLIATDIISNNPRSGINTSSVMAKALMHDVDEMFSGDFIRMFKHSSSTLKKEINKACENMMADFCIEIASDANMRAVLLGVWKFSKEDDEGRIVAFADFLSVVSYIAQEFESGNERMLIQVQELRKFYNSFLKEEFAFLEPYLQQTNKVLRRLEDEALSSKSVQGEKIGNRTI